MSGHNKWSKIKHKKAATDAQKSKIFGKMVRLIQVEAKKSNGDVNSPGLKLAIDKANKANMPKDNIDRAIKKSLRKWRPARSNVRSLRSCRNRNDHYRTYRQQQQNKPRS